MNEKKLSKSDDKILLGVCGGIAEFISWDKQTVRILWVILTIFAGLGILAYLILALFMPSSSGNDFDLDSFRKE